MTSGIQWDATVRQELTARGVTEKTGVYGEHKVRIGQGPTIDLASLKSAKVPFAGFRSATKISRGWEGVQQSARDAVKVLTARKDGLNAQSLLESLKAAQTHVDRLGKLGKLSEAQARDSAWVFAGAVEQLSNAELAAAFESFTSAEMDLLQTALIREGESNPEAEDARKAARQLFDLQALVLKEVSNRSATARLNELRTAHPQDRELAGAEGPQRLSGQYGISDMPAASAPAPMPHDISTANLETLVKVAAQSASTREQTAAAEQQKLSARSIEGVSVRDMADIMRSADLTINIDPRILLEDGSVFDDPDAPLKNIFHLAEQGRTPKGEGYLARRDSVEQLLFPELVGHGVNADERPTYGALNVAQGALGATPVGYGSAAIILKPETAKRATYTVDDTFYAPRMAVTAERRQNFFALLDGQPGLPQGFKDALRDPDSPQRKDLDAWLDRLQSGREMSLVALKNTWPQSVGDLLDHPDPAVKESNADYFQTLLIRCFGDVTATRSVTATHDNLEALIPVMGDVGGNDLARAALEAKNGRSPRAVISGINYIEAQIHGPIVPSRDIAEIRIDLEDLPRGERPRAIARAGEFQERTGIKVTLFNRSAVIKGKNTVLNRHSPTAERFGLGEIAAAQQQFNAQHIDKVVLDSERQEYLAHLKEHVDAYVARYPGLAAGLPEGALHLEGNALDRLGSEFTQKLEEHLRDPADMDAKALVMTSFDEAVRPLLQQKATLLREVETLPFDTPAQKAAFTQWVCSAKDLRSPQEMRIVHAHAMAQAAAFREIAEADPPPDAQAIFRTMARLTADAKRDLDAHLASLGAGGLDPDYMTTQPNRISFMSLAMLQNGEPPFGQDGLRTLHDQLNGADARSLQAQLGSVAFHGFEGASDLPLLSMLCQQMEHTCTNLSGLVGLTNRDTEFIGGLTLIPVSTRSLLRSIAPSTAQKLDAEFPGFPSFPAPERPDRMPRDDAARRDFLISVLDGYLDHEKTFELGTSVHGRGHICRAYIFANAMCGIMEENGIPVDRNAVLCGIAGHDLGRRGGGTDHWEGRSADLTVQAMWATFGSGVMGKEYMDEVHGSIDAHKSKTLESTLLNAADSLDIGRTAAFDPSRFAFLRGENGERIGTAAKRIRSQLAREADLLQRLTNPYCALRNAHEKLFMQRVEAANSGNMELANLYGRQREDLEADIAEVFRKDWEMSSEDYMSRFEGTIRQNPQLFPLLSKYYH